MRRKASRIGVGYGINTLNLTDVILPLYRVIALTLSA
jgi:hypothetical protein